MTSEAERFNLAIPLDGWAYLGEAARSGWLFLNGVPTTATSFHRELSTLRPRLEAKHGARAFTEALTRYEHYPSIVRARENDFPYGTFQPLYERHGVAPSDQIRCVCCDTAFTAIYAVSAPGAMAAPTVCPDCSQRYWTFDRRGLRYVAKRQRTSNHGLGTALFDSLLRFFDPGDGRRRTSWNDGD